ncbi:MAG: hypothetical protein RJQ09_12980 [Cyclobacteriaceae bacterium]
MKLFHPYFSVVKNRNSQGKLVGYDIHLRIFTDHPEYEILKNNIKQFDNPTANKHKHAAGFIKVQIKMNTSTPIKHRQRSSIIEHEFKLDNSIFAILNTPGTNKPYIHIEVCNLSKGPCQSNNDQPNEHDDHDHDHDHGPIGGGVAHVVGSSAHHDDDED